jgi:hypothetical protein
MTFFTVNGRSSFLINVLREEVTNGMNESIHSESRRLNLAAHRVQYSALAQVIDEVCMACRSVMSLVLAIVLVANYSIASAGAAQSDSPARSLCRSEEQIFFSCPIAASVKTVSLCGSKTIDSRRGYIQYRFGQAGAVELQFPRDRANTQRVFRYAQYFRAQAERTEITFDNEDYRYVLFDYYEGDVKPAIREAGVRITRHGGNQRESEIKCAGYPISKLGSLESILARDMDNPLNR